MGDLRLYQLDAARVGVTTTATFQVIKEGLKDVTEELKKELKEMNKELKEMKEDLKEMKEELNKKLELRDTISAQMKNLQAQTQRVQVWLSTWSNK